MALSAPRNTKIIAKPTLKGYRMAVSTTIYKGGMVCADSDGFLIPADDAGNANTNVLGVADETRTSGASENPMIRVRSGEIYEFDTDQDLLQTNVGSSVYVEDDHTLDLVGGVSNNVVAGTLVERVSATVAKVFIPTPGHQPSANISTANIVNGAVTTLKLETDVLSADSDGRDRMATDFFNAATVDDKFDTDSINVANAADIIEDAAIVTDHIAGEAVTVAKLADAVAARTLTFGPIPITDTVQFDCHFNEKATITNVRAVVTEGLSANETVVTVADSGGDAIGAITVDSSAAIGDKFTIAAIDTNYDEIAAGAEIQIKSDGACSTGEVILTIEYDLTA